MQDKALLQRIAFDPRIMAGKAVIRGTRLSVEFILNLRAHGASEDEILTEYSGLTRDDIRACYLLSEAVTGSKSSWKSI